ncbi:MAG: DNA-binding protein [Deltaproteobacteria bacterium]
MNRKFGLLISAIALLMLVSACSKDNKQTSSTEPSTKAPAATATAPASSEEGAPGSIISGKVLETLDASGYTYLHLDQGTKKTWVAVPKANVNVGDEVSVVFSMVMKNFQSKTLGRTFDEVIFSSGFAPSSQPTATTGKTAESGSFSDAVKSSNSADVAAMTGGSGAAVAPLANEVKVEKATGKNAYTVGELFAKKAELNGKPVTLRGKVVKVSKNIMGKNWVHIQDGTGDPKEKSHDFVVSARAPWVVCSPAVFLSQASRSHY